MKCKSLYIIIILLLIIGICIYHMIKNKKEKFTDIDIAILNPLTSNIISQLPVAPVENNQKCVGDICLTNLTFNSPYPIE